MRRVLLLVMLVGLVAALAAPALAGGNGAENDRANDCWFPGDPPFSGMFEAHDLRVQKVRTPAGSGQFHCHGMIDNLSQAPAKAVNVEGPCLLPVWFVGTFGEGRGVVTPTGHINITCHFGP